MKRYDHWENERGADPFREAEGGEWCKADDVLQQLQKIRSCLLLMNRRDDFYHRKAVRIVGAISEADVEPPCVRPGHPEACENDPKVGCCYWRDAPELP